MPSFLRVAGSASGASSAAWRALPPLSGPPPSPVPTSPFGVVVAARFASTKSPSTSPHLSSVIQDEKSTRNLSKLKQEAQARRERLPFTQFQSMIDARREQAKRTLCVQVASKYSAESLFVFCSKNFGKIRELRYHENKGDTQFSHFYLVEFEEAESVRGALQQGVVVEKGNGDTPASPIPVSSNFLWFRETNAKAKRKGGAEAAAAAAGVIPVYVPVAGLEERKSFNVGDDCASKRNASGPENAIHGQIADFYEASKMTETSLRLRFLACEQVELSISGLFPRARVLPFGSSVNSYGTCDSDVDMVVRLDHGPAADVESSQNRLVFHAKESRDKNSAFLYELSNIISNFLPGCQNAFNVFNAKVPIIKYNQRFLGLECDISAGSTSGHYMSELLHLYGELDPRVRPLVFFVRKWARSMKLTETPRPTPKPTHFTLTMMVLFFLQHEEKILPPLNLLKSLGGKKDRVVCEDGIDCTYLRDLSGMQPDLNSKFDSPHSPSLAKLVYDFFRFYGGFDFKSNALCILAGKVETKKHWTHRIGTARSNGRSSYNVIITNPLEPDLNVSANVSLSGLEKLQQECRIAADTMDQMFTGKLHSEIGLLLASSATSSVNLSTRVINLNWEGDNVKGSSEPGRAAKRLQESEQQSPDWRKKHLQKRSSVGDALQRIFK